MSASKLFFPNLFKMEFFVKRDGTLVLVDPKQSEMMRDFDICDTVREDLGMSEVKNFSEHT
jgi:hypothetical protein